MYKKLYQDFKTRYFESGEIFSSALSGQYHISCFVLSSVIAEDDYINSERIIKKCLIYLDKEFQHTGHLHSIDFTIENLCLAHFVSDCEHIKSLLADFLIKYTDSLETQITAYATDYYLLRYFNIEYYKKYLNISVELNDEFNAHISKIFEMKWFLADSLNGSEHIPDLAYHCRNLQILMGIYLVNECKNILSLIKKGLQALIYFGTEDGRFCFYGRSANLVYGYASLYTAVKLIKNKKNIKKIENLKNYFLHNFVNLEKNEIYVTELGIGDEKRLNFDSYVYPLVYKIFTLSRILLSNNEKYNSIVSLKLDAPVDDQILYDNETGFIFFKADFGELTLNLRGHPNAMIRPNDNRYLPLNFVSKTFKVPDHKIYYAEARSTDRIIRKVVKKIKNYVFGNIAKQGFGYCPVYYNHNTRFHITKYSVERVSERKFKLTPLQSSLGIRRQPEDFSLLRCYIEFGKEITLSFECSKSYSLAFPVFHFENEKLTIGLSSIEFKHGAKISFSRSIADVKTNRFRFKTPNGVARRTDLSFDNHNSQLIVKYNL